MTRAPSEQELIETYRATIRPLYAYVSRRVGDVSLAEDLVQEAWRVEMSVPAAALELEKLRAEAGGKLASERRS